MASSSAIMPKEKYDVFISFRGEDTRKTFTSHLHDALIRRKIDTYIDYRLQKGEELEPALLKAIEESKIYVIIFSIDYASSTWCLKELAYILECHERNGHYVIPVFYGIDPSDVRSQKRSYETAFSKHDQRLDLMDKVLKWKEALTKAANLSGYSSTSTTIRDDSDLVEQVVRDVLIKLNRASSSNLSDHLVGVEARIQSIILGYIIPDNIGVRFIAIWGMGGIGKTTLADAVFHRLSYQFEACCFLRNVRERSGAKGNIYPQPYALRDELLKQLVGDRELTISTPTVDSYVKERLNRKKVLVVLDDVNHLSQLEFLAGDQFPFGPGSRIVITTRDLQPINKMQLERKLVDCDVKIYKVEELNGAESLKLFHSNVVTDSTRNSKLFERVVAHAAGIPLALKVLRSLFLRCKAQDEMELLWDKLRKFPNKELQNVYRASYDGLEPHEKEIFLDIACLHKGMDIRVVKSIIATCGLFADVGIGTLIDMSLISIKPIKHNYTGMDDYDCIWMHDVIQEMGVDIVKEECADEPGNRSRLHKYKDVFHVLKNNTGTSKIHSIHLDFDETVQDSDKQYLYDMETPIDFRLMRNLRFLTIQEYTIIHPEFVSLPSTLKYLLWGEYPSKSLPSNFSPENLVELHMRFSKLQTLWNEDQNPVNLKIIDLSYSYELVQVAFLSNCVNIERINLKSCVRVQVPDLTKCVNIKSINLSHCDFVQVPDLSNNLNIESIDLRNCKNQVTVPLYFGNFAKLTYLNGSIPPNKPIDLSTQYITQEPPLWCPYSLRSCCYSLRGCSGITTISSSSIECMTWLASVDLQDCWFLVSLPTNICKLKSLESLYLSGCIRFKVFPDILEPMESLKYLDLRGTGIEVLPSSFGNLVGLETLGLSFCSRLRLLPDNIYKLNHLTSLDLSWCTDLQEFPDCFGNWPALESLTLSGTKIDTLHPTIKLVSGLKSLILIDCKQLQSLPELPCLLQKLDASGCSSLETVSVSVTSPTQGLDQILSERTEHHSFHDCFNLDMTTRSNIMDDAHHRIMRMATAWNNKRQLYDDLRCRSMGMPTTMDSFIKHMNDFMGMPTTMDSFIKHMDDFICKGKVELHCDGSEIPKWLECRSEGCSMNIKLPLHWSDTNFFLGFALTAVVSSGYKYKKDGRWIKCLMILKTNNGEGHRVNLRGTHSSKVIKGRDNVLVWYANSSAFHVWPFQVSTVLDEAKCSTEASFHFRVTDIFDELDPDICVKRCGVSFLYADGQDDILKFKVINPIAETSTMQYLDLELKI